LVFLINVINGLDVKNLTQVRYKFRVDKKQKIVIYYQKQ